VKHIPYGYDEISNSMLDIVFFGDDALNYTLYGVAPDNSQYPQCTTFYCLDYGSMRGMKF
jgi:hypothetical protein